MENTTEKKTRLQYLKDQLVQDYEKAVRKHKLVSFLSPQFGSLIQTAGLSEQIKIPRGGMREMTGSIENEKIDINQYIDPAFFVFLLQMGPLTDEQKKTTPVDLLFNFFQENDPSTSKEYLHWYLNLYRDIIKQRKPFGQVSRRELSHDLVQDGKFTDMLQGGKESRFFEDCFKVNEALELFDFLKKTKTFKEEYKNIDRYENFETLLKRVKPFMAAEEGSNDVDTLDHKELLCIQNQLEWEKKGSKIDTPDYTMPRASIVHDDDNWLIVITHNKESNNVFGKYTTWCTAGTRYSDMFKGYHERGPLFVLVKKGHGSKKAIEKNAQVRIQMHFESDQYMCALDRAIDVADFLDKNPEVKQFFKHHIVKEVLPKKGGKTKDHVDFLMKLGYGDQIIKIYKEVQPETIDFSSYNKITFEHLEEIGDIVSLKKLILQDCNLKKLPESMRKLKNLELLNLMNNKGLTEVPAWISELTKLTSLMLAGCDIRNEVDVSGLVNLVDLKMDYNKNLKHFPKGTDKLTKANSITVSNCDIQSIPDDVLACTELYMLDAHNNKRLDKIPTGVTQLPQILAVCLDDTKIDTSRIQVLNSNTNQVVQIVKFQN